MLPLSVSHGTKYIFSILAVIPERHKTECNSSATKAGVSEKNTARLPDPICVAPINETLTPKLPVKTISKSGQIFQDKNGKAYSSLKYEIIERNINHDPKRSSLVTEL